MASLRDVGASIDGSGFDEGWIEAGLYGSTTTRQILKRESYKARSHSSQHNVLCFE